MILILYHLFTFHLCFLFPLAWDVFLSRIAPFCCRCVRRKSIGNLSVCFGLKRMVLPSLSTYEFMTLNLLMWCTRNCNDYLNPTLCIHCSFSLSKPLFKPLHSVSLVISTWCWVGRQRGDKSSLMDWFCMQSGTFYHNKRCKILKSSHIMERVVLRTDYYLI